MSRPSYVRWHREDRYDNDHWLSMWHIARPGVDAVFCGHTYLPRCLSSVSLDPGGADNVCARCLYNQKVEAAVEA